MVDGMIEVMIMLNNFVIFTCPFYFEKELIKKTLSEIDIETNGHNVHTHPRL